MARLDELERKFEENPRRYFAPLANEYRKAGDAAKAAELCRSQLPDVPGHISGHIVLGQALFDAGDFAGARTALETALALDPENIVALRYLGDIARDTGDTAEAERWYSRTLEADPYNEAATQGLQALRERDSAAVATGAPAEAPAEAPAPAALAEGFEPTAHAVEPLPADSLIEPTGGEPLTSAAADSGEIPSAVGEAESEVIAPPAAPADLVEFVSIAVPGAVEERSSEPAAARAEVPAAPTVAEPAPAPADDVQVEDVPGSAEFAGDLAISAASETPDESNGEMQDDSAEPPAEEAAADEAIQEEERVMESPAPEALSGDEAMQAEERVMESAAPFVTETMADLYLEQGYPHEALELLLQLAEQRPEDERLHEKVAHIESVIAARRDAAVAAARAERAEMARAAGAQTAAAEDSELAAAEVPEVATAFEISPFLPADGEAPTTVREMFARMDRARPRPPSSVTPRPLSRLRSDFVPMPDSGGAADESADDPFAFPDAPRPEQRVPRTSGPQPAFNPSTADIDEFEAWLRGLKGP